MNRRHFFALASGLLVPWEPERSYSFLPAWRLIRRDFLDSFIPGLSGLELSGDQIPGQMFFGLPYGEDADDFTDAYLPRPLRAIASSVWGRNVGVIHPSNLLDVQKSLEAFGYHPLAVSNA